MNMFSAIVQTIVTRWTKVSRGAPMAALRNATPEVLDLSGSPSKASSDEAVWHDVHFIEPAFLKNESIRRVALTEVRVPGLDLAAEPSDGVRVDVFGRRAFVVLPAETGTVIYNWVEDVIDDGWRSSVYRKVVAHVACGVPAKPTVFRRRSTHHRKFLREMR